MRSFPLRLNGQQLKLSALLFMTLDHVGLMLFPEAIWLRVIGRLSFPIFAYMIAEGCRYTRSRLRYFLMLVAVAIPCQIVYAVVMHSAYMCIMVTFALSVGLVSLFDKARCTRSVWWWLLFALMLGGVWVITTFGPVWWGVIGFDVDYGFWGVMAPLIIFLGRNRPERLVLGAAAFFMIAFTCGDIQWFSLGALVLLALYDGTRGRKGAKYLFYVYYPLHLAVIGMLDGIIG